MRRPSERPRFPHISSALLLFVLFARSTLAERVSQCSLIDYAFKQAAEVSELQACHCFTDSSTSSREARSLRGTESIWIGCTHQKMPQVFNALNALNESIISKLWIWDSLINILPTDMFAQVRPRVLSIESSGLSLFRAGAFSNIGQRLKVLQLRNNLLKQTEPIMFKDLNRLEVLDLAGNKLTQISAGQLDKLKDLETLIVSDNFLANIEDGAFHALSNLKTLNLANNKLTNITKNTFRGLNNLETLNLQSNDITYIDWSAFAHMKNLKLLDIGNNHVERVDLRGLESLEKLYVNNNSIKSLKNVSLRDLRSLHVLRLDRNAITVLADGDLHSLGESARLSSLSLAANKMTQIDARAFEPVHSITSLSLEDNLMTSLSSNDGTGNVSFLRPLKKLANLFLSNNKLTHIDENDLSLLTSLKFLALDHNEIDKIHSRAFVGLCPGRLYLNNNHLFYLPKGTFDSFTTDVLDVIDLSDNPWECRCGEEWLADWLLTVGERSVESGHIGCIKKRTCPADEEHSVWITVIASALAVVSLLILVAIGFLYLEDGRRVEKLTSPLRRVPSDLLQLIPNGGSSMSLPHDAGVEPLLAADASSQKAPSTGGRTALRTAKGSAMMPPPPLIRGLPTVALSGGSGGGGDGDAASGNVEKKRVRFDGI